jgi:hypothetical protein
MRKGCDGVFGRHAVGCCPGLLSAYKTSPATTSAWRWCRWGVELDDEITIEGHP